MSSVDPRSSSAPIRRFRARDALVGVMLALCVSFAAAAFLLAPPPLFMLAMPMLMLGELMLLMYFMLRIFARVRPESLAVLAGATATVLTPFGSAILPRAVQPEWYLVASVVAIIGAGIIRWLPTAETPRAAGAGKGG